MVGSTTVTGTIGASEAIEPSVVDGPQEHRDPRGQIKLQPHHRHPSPPVQQCEQSCPSPDDGIIPTKGQRDDIIYDDMG